MAIYSWDVLPITKGCIEAVKAVGLPRPISARQRFTRAMARQSARLVGLVEYCQKKLHLGATEAVSAEDFWWDVDLPK